MWLILNFIVLYDHGQLNVTVQCTLLWIMMMSMMESSWCKNAGQRTCELLSRDLILSHNVLRKFTS